MHIHRSTKKNPQQKNIKADMLIFKWSLEIVKPNGQLDIIPKYKLT